jgi:hypothetical protein
MQLPDDEKYYVDSSALPQNYPTHLHQNIFWEELGRTIATFGFLEGVLTRAIFSLTSTIKYGESDWEEAFDTWMPKIEKSLSDQLGGLIDSYGVAVKANPDTEKSELKEFLETLREVARLRNVLCHGSWNKPDDAGASVPFFVNKKHEKFETPIDIEYLKQTRSHVLELSSSVMNSVTQLGWQFPGTGGPGQVIYQRK